QGPGTGVGRPGEAEAIAPAAAIGRLAHAAPEKVGGGQWCARIPSEAVQAAREALARRLTDPPHWLVPLLIAPWFASSTRGHYRGHRARSGRSPPRQVRANVPPRPARPPAPSSRG